MSRYMVEFETVRDKAIFRHAVVEFGDVTILDEGSNYVFFDDHIENSADGDHTYTLNADGLLFKQTGYEL